MKYIEISCLPGADVNSGFLVGKVMGILHLCLVNLEKGQGYNPVGVSFPDYCFGDDVKPSIGGMIRLFARETSHLEILDLDSQLSRFEDYIHMRPITDLDRPGLKFAVFRRVQLRSSRERLIRRQVVRSGESENVIRARYQSFVEEQTRLPYVNMKSMSSGRQFRLFVQKQRVEKPSANWQFSSYGLSSSIPVPDF